MQRTLLLCFLTIFLKQGFTQNQTSRPLQVGDTLTSFHFKKFFDSSSLPLASPSSGSNAPSLLLASPPTSLNSSPSAPPLDLRGKLVILDFWNTGCLACLKSMPKMDSLQQLFGDKLQVILITSNTQEQVSKLFSRIKIKIPGLPIVVEDTLYYTTLFPHVGDPLHVWINPQGVITAITDGHNATVSNIQSTLSGQRPKLYTRPPDSNRPIGSSLLKAGAGPLKPFVSAYSIFLRGLHEQTTAAKLSLSKDSLYKQLTRISATNMPLITLYNLAYAKELFGFEVNVRNLRSNNRIQVRTNHPLDLRYPAADSMLDEWNNRNLVSYEAAIAPASQTSLLAVLQTDLARYTPFEASFVTKELNCLVLQRTSKKDKLKTKHPGATPESAYNGSYSVTNKPLSASLLPELVIALQRFPCPIIDETHYTAPVDLVLNTSLSDLGCLRQELHKYDLDLVQAKRPVKLLAIKDKKHSSN